MNSINLLFATLIAAIILGLVIANLQQVSAPRGCGGCVAFKKLTHEFEKTVLDAATNGDPNQIAGLLEQYSEDVRALDFSTPRG